MAFLKIVSLLCLLMIDAASAQHKGLRLDLHRSVEPYVNTVDRRRSFGVYTHENYAIVSLYVTSYIGTPPQRVNLAVSFQYSNTFVFTPGSCGLAVSAVCPGGTFFPNQSTSFTRTSTGNYTLTYTDKSSLVAYDAKDNFGFFDNGQFQLKSFPIDIALNTTQKSYGQLGLGHYAFTTDASAYVIPPFLNTLVSQGLTKTRLFSIFNKDYDTTSGTLLFDDVDPTAYTGPLSILPVLPQTISVVPWIVSWTGFQYVTASGDTIQYSSTVFPVSAALLNGYSKSWIPAPIFASLVKQFNVYTDPTVSATTNFIDCAIKNATGYLDFTFGASGLMIQMPFRGLGIEVTLTNGTQVCQFSFLQGDAGGPYWLSDNFLRAAYVQYDYDNKQVAIAQANVGLNGTVPTALGGGVPVSQTGSSSVSIAGPSSATSAVLTAVATSAPPLAVVTSSASVTSTSGAAAASVTKASAAARVPTLNVMLGVLLAVVCLSFL